MKEKKVNLIFYYKRGNRYGFNAILGALETFDNLIDSVNIFFSESEKDLKYILYSLSKDEREKTLILFSFFSTQKISFFDLAKKIKKEFEEIRLMGGGPHPSGEPIETLENSFDYVLRGEGEKSFPEFLKAFLNGEEKEVKGISFFKSGKFHNGGKGERIELDFFPPFSLRYEKFGPIEITRGCPFVCYYCQTPQLFGAKVRHRSIDNILKYVEILKNRGMRDMRFISPNAFSYGSEDGKEINYDALETLLKEMKKLLGKRGRIFFGTFPSEVRPEHVNERTLEILSKYSDNKRLVIGAQTGSDKLLKKIHRGHSVEDVRRAVRLARKYNYSVDIDFIFGLPFEDEQDISDSLDFMEELISYGARIHAHTFMPLPQTPFSKSPPGKIPERVKKFINYYLPKGKIFGDWREQEKIAEILKSSKIL